MEKGISLEESTKVLIELDDNLPIWGGGGLLVKSAIQVERCDSKEQGVQNIIVYFGYTFGKRS